MSRMITRKFTMNTKYIYTVDGGVISKKSVVDFINENHYVYDALQKLDSNSGWVVGNNALMFTEHDDIFRVNVDAFMKILFHNTTQVIDGDGDSTLTVTYDASLFTDDLLDADDSYKNFKHNSFDYKVQFKMPVDSRAHNYTKCIFAKDPVSIYHVCGKDVLKEHVFNYVANNGPNWSSNLSRSDYRTGHILCINNVFLRIYQNKVERVKERYWEPIMKCMDTKVGKISKPDFESITVEYNNTVFTDSKILVGIVSDE